MADLKFGRFTWLGVNAMRLYNTLMRKDFAGVYCICNGKTGKMYVGGSIVVRSRITHHFGRLRAGKHACSDLQNAWDKGHEKNFKVLILDVVEKSRNTVESHEQFYLDLFAPYLYNFSTCANSLDARKEAWNNKERKTQCIKNIKRAWTTARRKAQAERARKLGRSNKNKIKQKRAKT